MATVCHAEFWNMLHKPRVCTWFCFLTLHFAAIYRRVIAKIMASVRETEFPKLAFFIHVTLRWIKIAVGTPNLLEIGRYEADVWRYNYFQNTVCLVTKKNYVRQAQQQLLHICGTCARKRKMSYLLHGQTYGCRQYKYIRTFEQQNNSEISGQLFCGCLSEKVRASVYFGYI